jgi:hypothetical protein
MALALSSAQFDQMTAAQQVLPGEPHRASVAEIGDHQAMKCDPELTEEEELQMALALSSVQFELDQTEARERRRAQVEADVTRIAESEEQVEHDRARRHAAKKAAKQRAAARRHEQKHVCDVGCDSMLNSGPDQVTPVGPESMWQLSDGCSVAMEQCPPAPQSGTEITRTNGPSIEHLGYKVGARVQLHSLIARPELNGQQGIVSSFDPDNGRIAVSLKASGVAMAFRAANLRSLEPAEMDPGESDPHQQQAALLKEWAAAEALRVTANPAPHLLQSPPGTCLERTVWVWRAP